MGLGKLEHRWGVWVMTTESNRRRARPLAVRLAEKLVQTESGCIVWTGTVTRDGGYGKISVGGRHGRILVTHRVAWELENGPIPEGLWVLHRCDNPPCCNVQHLFLGDSATNVADMVAKGRHRPQGRVPVRIGERQRRLARSTAGSCGP